MTVSSETSRVDYTGNGVTVSFPVPFRFLADDQLQVIRTVIATGVETVLTLDSLGADGYSVSGAGDSSGSVTAVTAPTALQRLSIIRDVPATQEADFVANDPFPAETFEDALDKLTMLAAQLKGGNGIERVLRLTAGDVDGSGRYDANQNRIVDMADGIDPTDVATVQQVAAIGSGSFVQAGTGATVRTMQDKARESVSVLDFTGADPTGVSDSTAAFEAALLSGRRVFVPAGTYRVDNVRVPSGRTLCGEGVASKLIPHTVGAAYVLEPDAGCTDVTIRDLWIDAPKATYPGKFPIIAGSPVRMRVERCKITGGAGPIFMVSATDCVVDGCEISDYVDSGISISTSAVRCTVRDCKIDGSGSALSGVNITGGNGTIIANNKIDGAGVFGIFMDNSIACVVSNNTTYETVREGINLNRCKNCAITGNAVSFLAVGTVGTDFGISLWGAGGVSRNNLISGNTVVNSFLSGIALAGDEDIQAYNVVIGNTIENCGRSNLADTAGVVIYGTDALNNLVTGNMVFDDAGVLRYGVFDDPVVGAPVGTTIHGNRVQGASVAPVSRSATSVEAMNGRTLRTWTPTVTAVSGTITTLGAVVGRYYEMEKMVFVSITIPITTNGTGAGALLFTLPFTASGVPAVLHGREGAVTGFAVTGVIAAGGTQAALRMYDNAYPGGNGREIIVSGWYERA